MHRARVFVDLTPGVPFKILSTSVPPMVRGAIIECAHYVRMAMTSSNMAVDTQTQVKSTKED